MRNAANRLAPARIAELASMPGGGKAFLVPTEPSIRCCRMG